MGLKERVTRRFLRELRRAGVKQSDIIVVPVEATLQSYATLRLLSEVEEGYDTVLRALVLEPLPECFEAALRGFDVVVPHSHSPSQVAEFMECGYALVVMPLSADDLAVSVLDGALRMDWSFFRRDVQCRVAYPLAGTTLGEISRLYGGCGAVRGHGGAAGELLGELEGRVTATALSKVYMRLREVLAREAGCLYR